MRSAIEWLRSKFHNGWDEIKARGAGHRAMPNELYKPIRHIVGPTGWMAQNTLGPAAEGAKAFNQSFEPRIPPSIHISHRDSVRVNMAMPLAERCIEDWSTDIVYADPHDELDLQ